jgi:hypothetical protein
MAEELNYKILSKDDLEKLLKRASELEDKAQAAYDAAKGIKDKDIRNKARQNRDIVIAERVAIQEALNTKRALKDESHLKSHSR